MIVSVTEGIASVTLDNPTQRNALTQGMCLQLLELMPRLDADPKVTVVTVQGAGTTFSAGATINDLTSVILDPQPDGTIVDHLSRADDAITSVSKPTIALVDGPCMGGGWQIASACDFIIASERSTFAITPAKIGIIYPRPGIERLVRQVGPANAKLILFSAEVFTARRAEALGLVVEVVSDDQFDGRCKSLTESICNLSRFSTHTMKRLVDATATQHPELDQYWDCAWTALTRSPDMTIGVDAFLNHEQPKFRWGPEKDG